MNEYILFDPALRDRFITFLSAQNVPHSVRPDVMEGYVVTLERELPDALDDAVEAEYEALMTAQRDLSEDRDDDSARSLMRVEVTLASGQGVSVDLPARYARRLHDGFTIDEIRELVALIAESAIAPKAGPICRRN